MPTLRQALCFALTLASLAITESYSAPVSLPVSVSENLSPTPPPSLPLLPALLPPLPWQPATTEVAWRAGGPGEGVGGRSRTGGGGGRAGKDRGYLARAPEAKRLNPPGGPYWAKPRCRGRGRVANGLIHWRTGAWRRDSVGEAGGANGREVDGGVVSRRQVGGVWLTLSREAGCNPREGAGSEGRVT